MQPVRNQRNKGRSPITASQKEIVRLGLAARSALFFGLAVMGFVSFIPFANAATGTISSSYKYAWSNVGGWVNFAPTHSTVTVTDSGLTGYAWSANDGWINLAPTNGGVTNSGGTLGGFAWDQSAGWVNFSGVTIDSAGKFHGQATGANGYAINFSCTNCDVRTDWKAASAVVPVVPAQPGSISPVIIPPLPSVPPATPPTVEAPPGVEPPAGERPPAQSGTAGTTGYTSTAPRPGGAVFTPGSTSSEAVAPVIGHAPGPARMATSTMGSILKSAAQFARAAVIPLGIVLSIIAVFFFVIFFR